MRPNSHNCGVYGMQYLVGESFISCCSHVLRVQVSLSVEVRLKCQVVKGLSKDDFTEE